MKKRNLPDSRSPAGEQLYWYGRATRSPARRREEGGPPDLQSLRGFLRRQWAWMAAGFAGVVLAVLLVTWWLPERWESEASFLVERQRPVQQVETSALSQLDRVGQLANTQTEVELVTSRRVLAPVVEEQALHVRIDRERADRPDDRFPAFSAARDARPGRYRVEVGDAAVRVVEKESGRVLVRGAPGDTLRFAGLVLAVPPSVAPAEIPLRVAPFEEALSGARKRVAAEPVQREADLIGVTCEAASPEAARRLCAAVMESYVALRTELQRSEATAAVAFLGDQVRRVEERLRAAEDTLSRYRERRRAVALETRASEEVRRLAGLQARQEELKAERRALADLIETIESERGSGARYRQLASFPSFVRSQDQVVTRLVESLVELENRRSDLAVRRTRENPELAALDRRIEEIEEQLRSMATTYERGLSRQVASLDSALVAAGRQLSRIPAQQVEVARLERRVGLLGELYSFLQRRLREAEVAEAVELPSVRIVDRASLPFEPSFPNLPLNLALGGVLGLAVGLLVGLWREYADTSLRDREDVEREAGVPVLASIPHLRGHVKALTEKRALPGGGSGRTGVLRRGKEEEERERRAALEAFRTLAVELDFAGDGLNGRREIRTVAVTSPGRGEGKTFTASNLALSRAREGARVLLVDADLRAAGVSRMLVLTPDSEHGLSDVLGRGVALEEALHRYPVDGTGRALDVLPSGRLRSGADAPLIRKRLGALLEWAAGHYDLVVVDTPPLNLLADAAEVAASVDGVVVVVRQGVTEREALETTLDRLERARGRVAGIVLNDVELSSYYADYPGADRYTASGRGS